MPPNTPRTSASVWIRTRTDPFQRPLRSGPSGSVLRCLSSTNRLRRALLVGRRDTGPPDTSPGPCDGDGSRCDTCRLRACAQGSSLAGPGVYPRPPFSAVRRFFSPVCMRELPTTARIKPDLVIALPITRAPNITVSEPAQYPGILRESQYPGITVSSRDRTRSRQRGSRKGQHPVENPGPLSSPGGP